MKGMFARGLSLSLGLLAGTAQADELLWRPVAASPTVSILASDKQPPSRPAVTLGRAQPLTSAGKTRLPIPHTVLGTPVALVPAHAVVTPGNPVGESQVTTVAFSPLAIDPLRPVVRAKSADAAQPMPRGKPGSSDAPVEDLSFANPVPSAGAPVPFGHAGETGFGMDCGSPCGPLPGCDPCPAVCCPCDGPACCGMDCCACPTTQRSYLFWVSAEALGWAIKDAPAPPLVTSSLPGTPRSLAGVFGVPGTATLAGGPNIEMEEFLGGRFSGGVWLNPCKTVGLEGSFLFLGQRTNNILAGSPGVAILGRPFFDASLGIPNAELVSFPGVIGGSVGVTTTAELWGTEANVRCHAYDGCLFGMPYRLDLLGGFRFLELKESLTVIENLVVPVPATISPGGPVGIIVVDRFKTNNQFYGGQVGADLEFTKGKWFLDTLGKVGIGTMHQGVDVGGLTTMNIPGALPITNSGGLLVQGTNMGHFSQNRFGVVSEFGLKLGYEFNDHWRVYAGYTFLWMNNVARPGNQIDPVINPTQLPSAVGGTTLVGAARPLPPLLRQTDFWAQGVNLGLEFRY